MERSGFQNPREKIVSRTCEWVVPGFVFKYDCSSEFYSRSSFLALYTIWDNLIHSYDFNYHLYANFQISLSCPDVFPLPLNHMCFCLLASSLVHFQGSQTQQVKNWIYNLPPHLGSILRELYFHPLRHPGQMPGCLPNPIFALIPQIQLWSPVFPKPIYFMNLFTSPPILILLIIISLVWCFQTADQSKIN